MQANTLLLHTLDPWSAPESGHVAYQIKGTVGHALTMVIYTKGGLRGEVFFKPVGDSYIAYNTT